MMHDLRGRSLYLFLGIQASIWPCIDKKDKQGLWWANVVSIVKLSEKTSVKVKVKPFSEWSLTMLGYFTYLI
ncbi:proteasome subunit alpha type-5 [Gossypium australe]|uniref:Proteasome subunit alpha type-5 n=1 Tax=Gossypium australe TaxID=47621 RepID=A0A5B6WCL2_9ROSI|nr:proteasome subunit alpha type-5 [Gossypium australe]